MSEEAKDGQLRGFADWLHERRLVADHRIPYFVRWVERFRRLSQSRAPEDWHDTLLLTAHAAQLRGQNPPPPLAPRRKHAHQGAFFCAAPNQPRVVWF